MANLQRVQGMSGLARAIARDLKKLRKEVIVGVAKTAMATGHQVAQNVPIAFGELRQSVHVDATNAKDGHIELLADAPHAAAVEEGSKPHVVPLEALVKWVKLRGAQGLSKRRAPGTTTPRQSRRVAEQLGTFAANNGGSNDLRDVLTIAEAIQHAIAKRGTKPHWMFRNQLGFARRVLDEEMRAAVARASR